MFLNYVSSMSLDIALMAFSSERRRRVVLLMESVQISPYHFVCKRALIRVDVIKFRV